MFAIETGAFAANLLKNKEGVSYGVKNVVPKCLAIIHI